MSTVATAPESVLEVTILQAYNLPTEKWHTDAKLYCLIEVTNSKDVSRTHWEPCSACPEWKESLQVRCLTGALQVSIENHTSNERKRCLPSPWMLNLPDCSVA